MTWLTPTIAGVAAAIAVPSLIILYFLKLRRRDVEVSTTLLWKKAVQDLQANAPFQKLRRNLLLFLQLLVLAAILAAVGQPEVRAGKTSGGRHIILIDRSASMQAMDAGDAEPRSRIEQARREAIKLVDSLDEANVLSNDQTGDQAMVIAFDTVAEVRQHFTSNKAQLRDAIEGILATDAPSSLAGAMRLAKAYTPRELVENKGFVAKGPPATFHLFSDGRIPDSSRIAGSADDPAAADFAVTPEDTFIYHAVGQSESGNIGITAVGAQRSFSDPSKLTVFVGLQSTFRDPRQVDVELVVDGQVAGVAADRLRAATKPGVVDDGDGVDSDAEPAPEAVVPATGGVVFNLDRVEGAVMGVRVITATPDALGVDDRAFLVVPPARRLSVLLVSEGNLTVRTVLEGLNLSRFDVTPPADFQRMFDAESYGGYDVIILDKFLPVVGKKPDGSDQPGLPRGRVLVLGAIPPPPLGADDDGETSDSLLVDWRRDHLVLRDLNLSDILIGPHRKMKLPEDTLATVLAQDQNGPVMIEAADSSTRTLVLSFDPNASNMFLRGEYIVFIASAIKYLGSDGAEGASRDLKPGQTLAERLPIGAEGVRITLPDNTAQEVVASADGRVAFGPLRQIGIHTLSWKGPAGATDVIISGADGAGEDAPVRAASVRRAVAANLLDSNESDIGTASVIELPHKNIAASDGGDDLVRRRLWPWLLLAALGIVLFEWFVYNKKVYL